MATPRAVKITPAIRAPSLWKSGNPYAKRQKGENTGNVYSTKTKAAIKRRALAHRPNPPFPGTFRFTPIAEINQ